MTRSKPQLREPRVTACVTRGDEAYVARERRFEVVQDEGWGLAEIWHTTDRGQTWRAIEWRRTFFSFLRTLVSARWPPDWVNRMWFEGDRLTIEVREDDAGWDPIWIGALHGSRWRVRFERWYDVNADGPIVPDYVQPTLDGFGPIPE